MKVNLRPPQNFNTEVTLLTRCTHGEKKHICEHCGKGFKDNQNLKNHVQYVHFKIKRFSCELCEKAGIEKSFTHFQGLKAQLYILGQ